MATLENVHGASLVPEVSPLNAALLEVFPTKRERDAAKAKQEAVEGVSSATNPKDQQAALTRLAQIDPATAKTMQEIIASQNEDMMKAAAMEAEEGLRKATFLQNLPDYQSRRDALVQMAQEDAAKGKPVDRYIQLSNMSEAQLENELLKMKVMGTDIASLTGAPTIQEIKTEDEQGRDVTETFEIDSLGNKTSIATQTKDATPLTTVGKINKAFNNNEITEEQKDTLLAQELNKPDAVEEIRNELLKDKLKIQQQQELKKNDPEYKLKQEKLELELAEKRKEVQEDKDQMKKAELVKEDSKRLVKELLENQSGVRGFVGPVDQLTGGFSLDKENLNAKTKINQLLNILTSENLGIMSGVLSETDIKIIQGIAGGGLDVAGDENAFIDELKRMYKSLYGEDFNDGVKTVGRFRVKAK